MPINEQQIITQSRLRCLDLCPRKHYYQYEAGIAPQRETEALRIGTVYHNALDCIAATNDIDAAFNVIIDSYANLPTWADQFEWLTEREKLLRLFAGYVAYWKNDGATILETETVFNLPILNPETGAPTPLFRKSGKMDKKVRLVSGLISLREHKTTGDDIKPDSEYWDILRLDPQISMYFTSDPTLQTIEYDVTRKPRQSPCQTKTISKDEKADYAMNGRWFGENIEGAPAIPLPERETVQMYGARLASIIAESPETFYARREVNRMDADVAMFNLDLWQKQKMLRYRQSNNCWPRNPSGDNCSWCDVKRPCFDNFYPIKDVPPEGFAFKTSIHPELENKHGRSPASNATPVESAVTAPVASEF